MCKSFPMSPSSESLFLFPYQTLFPPSKINISPRNNYICSLDEKIRKLDEQLLKHRDAIKKARPGPAQQAAQQRAMGVLRQKKLYEQQRDQLYTQQFNLDSAAFTMESMKDNVQTVQAMQASATEMKKLMKNNKELQVDNVYKVMDDMADLNADFEEVTEAMAGYSVPLDINDDELMAELDALPDDDLLAEATGTTGGVPAYLQDVGELGLPEAPTAPTGVPAIPVEEDMFGLPAAPQRN